MLENAQERQRSVAYSCFDRIYDIPTTALETLAGVDNQDGQFGVLVEYLLDATVVAPRLPLRNGIISWRFLFVTIL